jgi:hypothetical protein
MFEVELRARERTGRWTKRAAPTPRTASSEIERTIDQPGSPAAGAPAARAEKRRAA